MTAGLKAPTNSARERRALNAPEVVTHLSKLDGWRLTGDGAEVAIEKTWDFADFHQTMAFANAVAFIAHRQDHHPQLVVRYGRCVVRFNTHDVGGLSPRDFECAALVDALLA